MGKLLALQGRLKESIVSFETAVKLRPDDPVIREDLERVAARIANASRTQ